jgi:hypothetical protein
MATEPVVTIIIIILKIFPTFFLLDVTISKKKEL